MYRIGANTDYFNPGEDPSFGEFRRTARTFQAMHLDGVMVTGHHEGFVSAHCGEIGRCLEDNGLTVFQIHPPALNIGHPQIDFRHNAVECYKRWVPHAAAMKAQYMVVHLGGCRDIYDPAERRRAGVHNTESVGELLRALRGSGVKMLIENGSVTSSIVGEPCCAYGYLVEEIIEVIEAVDRKQIGICFDFGHCRGSGLDIDDELRTAGRYLAGTHLVDTRGIYEMSHPLPGEGVVDWPLGIRVLGEIGYRGSLVFEVHPGTAAKKGWDACRHRLEKSINFIKDLCKERGGSG